MVPSDKVSGDSGNQFSQQCDPIDGFIPRLDVFKYQWRSRHNLDAGFSKFLREPFFELNGANMSFFECSPQSLVSSGVTFSQLMNELEVFGLEGCAWIGFGSLDKDVERIMDLFHLVDGSSDRVAGVWRFRRS